MGTPRISEAFVLLRFPDALLSTEEGIDQGPLILEYVTYPGLVHDNTTKSGGWERAENPDVILILRVNAVEVVLDPRRSVTISAPLEPNVAWNYAFHTLPDDPSEIILAIASCPHSYENPDGFAADIDTFDQVLEQYTNNVTPVVEVPADTLWAADYFSLPPEDQKDITEATAKANQDLRGRLILVDSNSGEVLGTVGEKDSVQIKHEAQARKATGEQQPLLLDLVGDELEARQLFLRAIPPGEEDVISKTAIMLNNAIRDLTNFVASGITGTTKFYIARATPHASATRATELASLAPRPIQWMTSDRSQRNLSSIQGYSRQAVQISGKTMNMIERLIARTVVPKPRTTGPINTRASPRSETDPTKLAARNELPSPKVNPKVDSLSRSPRRRTVPRAKSKEREGMNNLIVPSTKDPPPMYSRNAPPPVHPASRTSSMQNGSMLSQPRGTSMAPPPLPIRSSSPHLHSKFATPPIHPSLATRRSSPGLTSEPGLGCADSSSVSTALQPRKPLGISGRLVLSAALLSETVANAQAKLMATSGDGVAAMVTHKYGTDAGESVAAITSTARDVTLVYMGTTGFVQDVTLRTAGRYVAQTQCNVGGRRYSLHTNGRGRVVQAEVA